MRGLPLFVFFVLLGAGSASAQVAQCAFSDPTISCVCTTPAANSTDAVGTLSGLVGDVQVTSQVNFSPVGDPNPVFIGDSIIVPGGAQATLSFGPACTTVLQPNTSLVVRVMDGCACAGVAEMEGAGRGWGGAIVAGSAVATGVAIVLTADDKPASP